MTLAHGDTFIEAETCDGIDNDCDGVVDNAAVMGGDEVCDGADNNCDGVIDEGCCVQIQLHCDPGSSIMQTICGGGTFNLSAYAAANISCVNFDTNVKTVTLHHCDFGTLADQSNTLTSDTNLCSLPGGCCSTGNRWNDEVCSITIQ